MSLAPPIRKTKFCLVPCPPEFCDCQRMAENEMFGSSTMRTNHLPLPEHARMEELVRRAREAGQHFADRLQACADQGVALTVSVAFERIPITGMGPQPARVSVEVIANVTIKF